ncbi:3D (Asp-Asp-Asp) domain-containing protein [Desulfitispora alkaliphila]|uniref:hypothetical protein n=1 Tax=Desulfitispora alkaliphila TaxID=622674 RepID=UPI003D1D457D
MVKVVTGQHNQSAVQVKANPNTFKAGQKVFVSKLGLAEITSNPALPSQTVQILFPTSAEASSWDRTEVEVIILE